MNQSVICFGVGVLILPYAVGYVVRSGIVSEYSHQRAVPDAALGWRLKLGS